MEQKIKTLLGDYAFTIVALQEQLEQANTQIAELKKELEECKKPTKKQ